MPGMIPAKDGIVDRHPVSEQLEKKTGFPFDSFDLEALDRFAQGGESFDVAQDHEPVEWPVEWFIEPRVKPGMTFQLYVSFYHSHYFLYF
jgi:hypothetical protein